MTQPVPAIIDWERFAQTRTQLGGRFVRVLDYFREDGAKSVAAIEDAIRTRNAIAVIGPADMLKNDAIQIGALSVAELAEDIEFAARDCVEWHEAPDALLEQVLLLRDQFMDTVVQLDGETKPLLMKRAR
jgi:histidine phosphotransfer protein HptB